MPEPGKKVFVIGSNAATSAISLGQGRMLWPDPPRNFSGITSTGYLALNSSTAAYAYVGRVAWSDFASHSLQHVHFCTGSNTQAGGSTLRIALQDVSTSVGPPTQGDSANDAFRDITLGSLVDFEFADSGIVSADGTNGGALKTVAHGSFLAVVMRFTSFLGADVVQLAYTGMDRPSGSSIMLSSTDSGATWSSVGAMGCIVFQASDGTYGAFTNMMGINQNTGFSSASTPDEYVQLIRTPVKMDIDGFWWHGTIGGSSGQTTVKLLTGSKLAPTTVASTTVVIPGADEPDSGGRLQFAPLPATVTVTANTDYWLSFTANTTIMYLGYQQCNNANLWGAFTLDSQCPAGSRTAGGAITDITTKRYLCGFRVARIWA